MMRWFAYLCVVATAFLLDPVAGRGQDRLPVRMKMEPLSLRQRSGAPIAVQIKLEYNRRQMLEGDLLLELHDTISVSDSNEDLVATLKFDDLVLVGTDYIFNAVLPPLNAGGQGNLAVRAWMETESGVIPLSSSLQVPDPPEPFDVLMPGPMDRFVVLCSASGRADFRAPSKIRRYLGNALSLDQFNPLQGIAAEQSNRLSVAERSRRVQYYAANWSSRALPEDPLSWCSFDVVLLADGALGSLSTAQLDGLSAWVGAGGSLCIHSDSPIRGNHLAFVQRMSQGNEQDVQYALGDDGLLFGISDATTAVVTSHYGLGNVAIIDPNFDPDPGLTQEEVGQLCGFLWRVRADSGVYSGQPWEAGGLMEMLKRMGVKVDRDEAGRLYLTKQGLYRSLPAGEREYVAEEVLRNHYDVQDRFAPQVQHLVRQAEVTLLPSDVKMVPTWVIGFILLGYVLAVGPGDYFLLGLLKARKYTWFVFPVVTILFTMLTIGVAHEYMGSSDTGGSVTVTDVDSDGTALRRSRLQMLFYGARTTHQQDLTLQYVTPVSNTMSTFEYNPSTSGQASEPLSFSGHYPQSYAIEQTVQQWTPRLLRTFSIRPEEAVVPQLDWSNATSVTTEAGRRRLGIAIEEQAPEGSSVQAFVLHGQSVHAVAGPDVPANLSDYRQLSGQRQSYRYGIRNYAAMNQLYGLLPSILASTTSGNRSDYFGLVSQVSPSGSGTLEDLTIHDPDDLDQWILVIIYQNDNDYEIYRRRYLVADDSSG